MRELAQGTADLVVRVVVGRLLDHVPPADGRCAVVIVALVGDEVDLFEQPKREKRWEDFVRIGSGLVMFTACGGLRQGRRMPDIIGAALLVLVLQGGEQTFARDVLVSGPFWLCGINSTGTDENM